MANHTGWSESSGTPGQLRHINKNHLHVDYAYQRMVNEAKVIAIARDFNWMAFGTITVAHRNGSYFVVDGQHRVLGARKRQEITDLPCIVLETKSQIEEAQGFLTAQTQRKPISASQKFKALLVVEDPHALKVNRLVESVGRSAANSSCATTVQCLALLLRLVERQEATLMRVWPLIAQVSIGHPLYERLVDGFVYIESHMPAGESLGGAKWSKRAMAVGLTGLMNAATSASAFYKKGGAKVWGEGMVQALNYGLRNRLELTNSSGGES